MNHLNLVRWSVYHIPWPKHNLLRRSSKGSAAYIKILQVVCCNQCGVPYFDASHANSAEGSALKGGRVRARQVTQLPANFSAKEKTKKWYTDLHTKPASYTISAEEERQMTYDMESSYNEFMSWLQEKRPG